MRTPIVVLKLGGELLEQAADRALVARGIAALARRTALVVVHGGGKEIDEALATAGIPKVQVDGLRVTDQRTLDVVVAVLAGAVNTRLVAALRAAGAAPVGLTAADAGVAAVRKAAPITTTAGDRVEIAECRPISRTKRWAIVRIVEKAPVQVDAVFQTDDGKKQPKKK